jgi:hypothetical protein
MPEWSQSVSLKFAKKNVLISRFIANPEHNPVTRDDENANPEEVVGDTR